MSDPFAGAAASPAHDPFAEDAGVYVLGALWLAHVVDVPVLGADKSAFSMGVRPFLAGDVAKMVTAGLLFPATWRLVGDR